ncbi:MAG: hypothetical protein COA36_01110 [Desulfotalea sp.]|nr:MAG: hypothetical protein COA36_01110 [Desulfotalea sp.]
MQRISQHNILVKGDSFAHCHQQVRKYFDLTTLVIYDCLEIREQQSVSGLDANFMAVIDLAQKKNKDIALHLIAEIANSGIENTEDLIKIEQGYLSKTLHLLSHFLDGFIGIDSYFYNLLDDSHWLFPETRQLIKNHPTHYWLIHVDGFTTPPQQAPKCHR